MMRPLPWRRICGTTDRIIRTMPKKLVSKIAWACTIELSSAPAGATPKPALLTSRSMRPSNWISCWTKASTDASWVTSSGSISNARWPTRPSRRLVPYTL
ncbi:hypothetical protein LMG27174_07119 [Paraburkholderia rhynchosiae]|uniref:Uncharacterized protein n=1 Tax=Paraburkholderia rhynchosiae TaxID=487049 RepID=A0A6J5CT78_9BURK|nr:hypothetical protein LMG27174_07119 [Paraburkholderia rhynchosiae]